MAWTNKRPAISFPCKDCKERHLNCHSDCEKYQNAKWENVRRKNFAYNRKYTIDQILMFENRNKASKASNEYKKFYKTR